MRTCLITAFPDLLMVHIKRFLSRDNAVVKLNNDTHCVLKNFSLSSSEYNLIATINHHGSVDSGHYSAYVNSSGRWFCCDDRKTFGISDEEVVNPASYILIFRKLSSE